LAGHDLRVLPGALAIARLGAGDPVPAWATGAGAAAGALVAVVRTPAELSIVCADACVPDGVRAERGWRALEVAGPLELSMTGVLAALTAPLARAGVAIFAVSTFDTDYVLVPAAALDDAVAVLRADGHRVA